MSEEIIKVLDELGKRFGIAIDWTSENVAPYVEQLAKRFINYEIVTSVFWIVFVAILFAISLIPTVKLTKMANKNKWYDEFPSIPAILCIILSVALAIAVFVMLANEGIDIATCFTFPEKMILEYIKTLM